MILAIDRTYRLDGDLLTVRGVEIGRITVDEDAVRLAAGDVRIAGPTVEHVIAAAVAGEAARARRVARVAWATMEGVST